MITVYERRTLRRPLGSPVERYAYVRSFDTYQDALGYAVLDAVKFDADAILVDTGGSLAPDFLPLDVADRAAHTVFVPPPSPEQPTSHPHIAGPASAEMGDIDL